MVLVLSSIYSGHEQFRGKLSLTKCFDIMNMRLSQFTTKPVAQAARLHFQEGRGLSSIIYSFLFRFVLFYLNNSFRTTTNKFKIETFRMVLLAKEHLKWPCFNFLFKGKGPFF